MKSAMLKIDGSSFKKIDAVTKNIIKIMVTGEKLDYSDGIVTTALNVLASNIPENTIVQNCTFINSRRKRRKRYRV